MMKLTRIQTILGAAVIGVGAASLITVASFAAGTSGDTSSTASSGSASSSTGSTPKGETLAHGSDCFSCHAVSQKVVGPSFQAVANKFAGKSGAETTLVNAIKNGHVGTWGNVPMPAHPQLSDSDTKEIVSWILAMKQSGSSKSASNGASNKTYSYTVGGKTVTTKFPIYQQGTKNVTPAVFMGFEQFNSYCFRCHGEDAVGGSYAPDLRRSLNNGMSESKFLSITMTGRKAKGMPSWAGFFTPKQINAIYEYVKGRAIGVVGTGRPAQ